jgi:Flp pilus assembly protein TadD
MAADRLKAEAMFFEGNRRIEAGEVAEADECFRRALELDPNMAEALANRALLRERAGEVAEAEDFYRRATTINPDSHQIYLNFGTLLADQKRFAEAEAAYRRALELAPQSPAVWSNLGVLLACLKHEEEAERCYRAALEIDPDYAKARFNLSYVLLRQGRFEEGWRCFEARNWYGALERHFNFSRWRGEDVRGKSVVIGFEAGHGDMIQFCRYAVVLKAMGAARITVVCHPALVRLFETLPGIDEVYSLHDDVPRSGWDFWTPPMSLPHYCGTRVDNIPAPIPYLMPDPALAEKWSRLLPASKARIGLVWKGNPRFENDADRSIPSVNDLAPLGAVPDVLFVSLQFGEEGAVRPPAALTLVALRERPQDFADTAAVVANLDLVISVDTAVAHLTGALGKPCWVLLPDYRTDWRWLTGRTDSPWYPGGMRLFRQPPQGGWAQVVVAVAEELKRWRQNAPCA